MRGSYAAKCNYFVLTKLSHLASDVTIWVIVTFCFKKCYILSMLHFELVVTFCEVTVVYALICSNMIQSRSHIFGDKSKTTPSYHFIEKPSLGGLVFHCINYSLTSATFSLVPLVLSSKCISFKSWSLFSSKDVFFHEHGVNMNM